MFEKRIEVALFKLASLQPVNCCNIGFKTFFLKTASSRSALHYNFRKEYNHQNIYFLLKRKAIFNIETTFFTDIFPNFLKLFITPNLQNI